MTPFFTTHLTYYHINGKFQSTVGRNKILMQAVQLPPQSKAVEVLTHLCRSDPLPIELNITILNSYHQDEEENDDYKPSSYPRDAFIKDGPYLGINANDLPFLARDFKKEFFSLRPFLLGKDDSTENAKDSHDGESNVNDSIDERIMDSTACLLLLCPDNSSAWADRRRSILLKEIDDNLIALCLGREFHFLNLLFTQHSKAPSSWAHRKWIYGKLIQTYLVLEANEKLEKVLRLVSQEIQICTIVAEKYPKNYYAWTHRLFCVRNLVNMWKDNTLQPSFTMNEKGTDLEPIMKVYNLLRKEIMFITPWLKRHVSDHSCVNYGSQVLHLLLVYGFSKGGYCDTRCLDHYEWGLEELMCALEACEEMLTVQTYSCHETLWQYRRLCSSLILKMISRKLNGCQISNSSILAKPSILAMFTKFLQHEISDLYQSRNIVNKSKDNEVLLLSENEQFAVGTYIRSYIIWVCLNLNVLRVNGFEKEISNILNPSDYEQIITSLFLELKKEKHVIHNAWFKMTL